MNEFSQNPLASGLPPPISSSWSSLLAWFAANPVAANLLMLLILLGGFVGLWQIDKEVFLQFRPPQVWVTAKYPGAGPQFIFPGYAAARLTQATISGHRVLGFLRNSVRPH